MALDDWDSGSKLNDRSIDSAASSCAGDTSVEVPSNKPAICIANASYRGVPCQEKMPV